MRATKKIRVLIVEDSRVNQGLLKRLLEDDAVFEVIGIVCNGAEAVEFVARNVPDVVSMDIYMPVMDGVEATRQIMQNTPVPIVIVSSFYNISEINLSFSILKAGAITILPRPFGPGHLQYHQTAKKYRNTLKMMAEVQVKTIPRRLPFVPNSNPLTTKSPETGSPTRIISTPPSEYKIIAIGASAGGPQVLQYILQALPSSIPVPILIVQHIDTNFAQGFADWLASTSKLPIHIARNRERMIAGHVYLPPGDHHLGLAGSGVLSVTKDPPERNLRPAVSLLFRDVLKVYGGNSIGIVLSGMGSDGAAELKELHDRGAYTMVQDERSCLVFGMPGEAIKLGGVSRILSPEEMVNEIVKLFRK